MGHTKLFLITYSYGVENRIDWKPSVQCPPYFKNILRHPVWNEWLFRKCQTNSTILQLHWNFLNGLSNYLQARIFSWLKLLFKVDREDHF